MSRIAKPCPRKPSTCPPAQQSTSGVAPKSSKTGLPRQTPLQKQVFDQTMRKSLAQPQKKVLAVGSTKSKICPPTVQTKKGTEKLVKEIHIEKTVQRNPKGEHISRYVRARNVSEEGEATEIEFSAQDMDPTHATETLGVNEVVSVASCVKQTATGTYRHKTIKKKTLKAPGLLGQINMNPAHLNRLVKEEAEDVENTLKMAPPSLTSGSAEKFGTRKKLQNLRMNSESMALLEKSVIHPTPAADEVEAETSPDVLADILHAVEKGATPDSAPQQIFNTLFPTVEDDRIHVSSAATGPLRDVVVPTEVSKLNTDEVIDDDMEKALTELTQGEQEQLRADVCADITPPKPPELSFKGTPIDISDEIPPWADDDINNVSLLIGAVPINNLSALDTTTMESKDISAELSNGIDYFLDADTIPYENKVQLRGTRLPKWFPGYMAAFPHIPEVVKIAKSPSGVLHTAWKAVQPKIFPDDSVLIM